MGYVIGPDGKLVDDGQGIGRPNAPMSIEEMADLFYKATPPMADGQGELAPGPAASPSPDGQGVLNQFGAGGVIDPSGNIVPPVTPVTKGAEGSRVKAKESISGPSGVVPGNTNPYTFQDDPSGQRGIDQGMGMVADAAQMAEGAVDARAQSAEELAENDRQRFEEEKVFLDKRQELEFAKADELESRSAKKAAIATESREEAKSRMVQWEADYQKAINTDVDPSRYWNSRSGFQKTMFILGSLAGGWVEHIYKNNTAFELLQANIVQDIGLQKDKIGRNVEFMKDKKGMIDMLNNLDRLEIEDLNTETLDFIRDYDVMLGAVDKDIDKIINRHGQANVGPELLKTKAELLTVKANIRNGLGNAYIQQGTQVRQHKWDQEEAAKQRGHERARDQQKHTWELEKESRAAINEALKAGETNEFNVDQYGAGMAVMQPAGFDSGGTWRAATVVQKGTVNVKKGMETEFALNIPKNYDKYNKLRILKDIVEGEGTLDKILSSTDRKAALDDAVLAGVGGSGLAPISDEDRKMFYAILTGSSTGVGEWARPGDLSGPLNRAIEAAETKGRMDIQLYTEPNADGTKATWDPGSVFVSPKSKDQGSDAGTIIAEWSEGGTNRSKKETGPEPEVAKSLEEGMSAIDTLFGQGDLESLEALAATLRDRRKAPGKTTKIEATKERVTKGRGGKLMPTVDDNSALIKYANDKLNELNSIKAMEDIANEPGDLRSKVRKINEAKKEAAPKGRTIKTDGGR